MSDRVEIATPRWTATLIKRPNSYGQRKQYYSATRVYGAVAAFAPSELKAYEDAVTADPNTDHRALRRAATAQARAGLLDALGELAPRFDVNFHDLTTGLTLPRAGAFKVKFNHKAGCSCGCSPGFIVDGDMLRVDGKPVDVWFDAPATPTMTITKKDLAQAVFYGLTELDRIKQELGV